MSSVCTTDNHVQGGKEFVRGGSAICLLKGWMLMPASGVLPIVAPPDATFPDHCSTRHPRSKLVKRGKSVCLPFLAHSEFHHNSCNFYVSWLIARLDAVPKSVHSGLRSSISGVHLFPKSRFQVPNSWHPTGVRFHLNGVASLKALLVN